MRENAIQFQAMRDAIHRVLQRLALLWALRTLRTPLRESWWYSIDPIVSREQDRKLMRKLNALDKLAVLKALDSACVPSCIAAATPLLKDPRVVVWTRVVRSLMAFDWTPPPDGRESAMFDIARGEFHVAAQKTPERAGKTSLKSRPINCWPCGVRGINERTRLDQQIRFYTQRIILTGNQNMSACFWRACNGI
jgi:hypothetical protein